MKKVCVVALSASLLFLTACGNADSAQSSEADTKDVLHLSEVFPASFDEVNHVEIVNGSSGERVVLSQKDEIDEFLVEMEKMDLDEVLSPEEKEGYSWMVTLLSNEEEYRMNGYRFGNQYFTSEPDFNELVSEYVKE